MQKVIFLFTFLALVFVGCGTYHFANGTASAWIGNTDSLVIVHVHFTGYADWQASGSIFDSGTTVKTSVHEKYDPGTWIKKYGLGGGTTIIRGNEVYFSKSLLYPFEAYWHRMPGPLVVRFYINTGSPWLNAGGGKNLAISSESINAERGKTYSYNINYSDGTIRIEAQ